MSRDYRPFENYLCAKHIHEQSGENGEFEFPKLYWVLKENGKETKEPMWNEEMRRKFPLCEGLTPFKYLYEKNKEEEWVFELIETVLREEISRFEEKREIPKRVTDKTDISNATLSDVVKDWFYGLLDDGFYYNTRNNEAFEDYVEERIKNAKRIRKELDEDNVKASEVTVKELNDDALTI